MHSAPIDIQEIRDSFQEGRLDYLIGAGSSIDAGLPGWSALNNRLLELFFKRQFSQDAKQSELLVAPEPDELEALAYIFVHRFGREPVIDLIKNSVGDEADFRDLLRNSLYGEMGQIELRPLQFELAATLGETDTGNIRRLVTTNFDNLLERAYCRLKGEDDQKVMKYIELIANQADLRDDQTESSNSRPQFVHLHGYLPDLDTEKDRGAIILSERDFILTDEDWQTTFLRTILMSSERDLLIIGMSLADPRLRRLLHQRAESSEEHGKVFVLLPKSSAGDDDPLAVRRAHKMVGAYEQKYWDNLGVSVKFVGNLDTLPLHLRRIRLGDDPSTWRTKARDFLNQASADHAEDGPVLNRLYAELKQRQANLLLARRLEHIRSRFEVPRDEELTLGYFVPSPEDAPVIQLAFRFNDHTPGDYLFDSTVDRRQTFQGVNEERSSQRRLRVETVTGSQGGAGYSFTTGAVVEVLCSSPELNRNFDNEMDRSWDSGRTFSSLLCVPIYGSPTWLPLGVGFLSSNRKQPFWAGISEDDTLALNREIRTTFRVLLEY